MSRYAWAVPAATAIGNFFKGLGPKAAKATIAATAAGGAVTGMTVIDESARAGDSVPSRAQQNIAEAAGAENAAGMMAGFKERIANILNFLSSLFPGLAATLKPWEESLRKNIDRPAPEKSLTGAIGDAVLDDPSAAAVYGLTAATFGGGSYFIANKLFSGGEDSSTPTKPDPTKPDPGSKGPGYDAKNSALPPSEYEAAKKNGQLDMLDRTPSNAGKAAAEVAETVEDASGSAPKGKRGILGIFVKVAAGLGLATIATTKAATASENDQFQTPSGTTPNDIKLNVESAAKLGLDTALNAVAVSNVVAMSSMGKAMLSEGLEVGFKAAAKRVPMLGGIITAGFTLASTAAYAMDGDFKKAGAELAAGAAETAVNFTGLGLVGGGDAARELVRGGIILAGGDEWAAAKSDVRNLFETATTGIQNLASNKGLPAPEATPVAVLENMDAQFQTAALDTTPVTPDYTSAWGNSGAKTDARRHSRSMSLTPVTT